MTVYYIEIATSAESKEDMAIMLRYIADEVEKGMLKGHYPQWEIKNESFNENNKPD